MGTLSGYINSMEDEKMNTELCSCGNCDDAVTRGVKVITDLMAKDKCVLFQSAVIQAAFTTCLEYMKMEVINQAARDLNIPKDEVPLIFDIKGSCTETTEEVRDLMLPIFSARRAEIRRTLRVADIEFDRCVAAKHKAEKEAEELYEKSDTDPRKTTRI